MKLKKEMLFVPAFLVVIFLLEKLFSFNAKSTHYVVEFISLFFTGLLIGIDKMTVCNNKRKIIFDKERFIMTFIPLIFILFIIFGAYSIRIYGVKHILLYNFLNTLKGIIMYKQVGMVLLGYFITSSTKFSCKETN